MNNKQILNSFPPLQIKAGNHPITVFRVESSPRLAINIEQEKRNTALRHLHIHFTYEVFFAVSGHLELLTESGNQTYQNAIVIIPSQIHHVTVRDGENYCLLFSFEQDSSIAQYLDSGVCVLPITEEISFYIRQLAEKTMLRTDAAEESVHYLASLIFHNIFQAVKPQPQGTKSNRTVQHINLIEEYFNQRYMTSITLSELAQHVHLSPRQTARIIKQEYHCSFTELLNNRRLSNAVSLLKNTELSIAQIIEKTFCNSPKYFYRIFRKKYGMSPLQYRKQMRFLYPKNI